jgi:non-ribosomal peptide synthetase component F
LENCRFAEILQRLHKAYSWAFIAVMLQVLFQYLESSPEALQLPWGLNARSSQYSGAGLMSATRKLDLNIEIEGRCIGASYSTELFDNSTINRMLQSYLLLLQQLVQAPDMLAEGAAVLQKSDKSMLLGWGAGEEQVQQLAAPLAHESFLAAAAAAPGSPCVVFEGKTLSYGSVLQRATALAEVLQAAGVGPGVAVGVLLERSLELPIAVLAVFMAGGCYVPLDPSYPEQRLQGYLMDSRAVLAVTCSSLLNVALQFAAGIKQERSSTVEVSSIVEVMCTQHTGPAVLMHSNHVLLDMKVLWCLPGAGYGTAWL